MMKVIVTVLFLFLALNETAAQDRSDPTFHTQKTVTMAEFKNKTTSGVSVVEVSDYVYGNYRGHFTSPPHADLNPRKAFIIFRFS
jgi:hypothetical protein